MSGPAFYDEPDPSQWRLAIRVVAMPADTNAYGDIFGGCSCPRRTSPAAPSPSRWPRVATVAVKEFRFVAPVLVGDLVDLYARLHRIGTTSITVEVRAWARQEPDPATRRPVAQALISYVAIGDDGKPRPVPRNPAPGVS
jgi:acyl-CoA thioesterase YciA